MQLTDEERNELVSLASVDDLQTEKGKELISRLLGMSEDELYLELGWLAVNHPEMMEKLAEVII